MRAAVFAGPGLALQLRELPDPQPAADEVVLRVERCGICSTDVHVTGSPEPLFPPGMILGHEVGGEVIAVGRHVDQWRVGDRVIPMTSRGCAKCADCLAGCQHFCAQMRPNFGGYAQYMLSSAAACVPVPAGLSLADAALVEPLTVGLHGITSAPLRPGDRVLVMGAGPVGLGVIFWANRFGARRVVVIAPSERRKQLALDMGATSFIRMDEGYEDRVIAALGGPPEVIVECAGAGGTLAKAIEMVKPRGTVVVIGLCLHSDTYAPAPALLKEVRIQFAIGTSKLQFGTAAGMLASGAVAAKAMVTQTIGLDALPQEFEALRGASTQCKVLVAP